MAERADQSAETVDRLDFRVLGHVQVVDHDGRAIDVGGSKPRLVLVQLLLSPNRVVSTEALIDALWGEDPPPTARRSLQSHVARLRAALGGDDGPVRSQPPGYILAVDQDQVDLGRSQEFARQARAALASDPWQAHHLVQLARTEWTGEPLADLAAHDSLVPQRRRLEQLRVDLIELELDAELAVGDIAAVAERLESLVLDRPEHEPFWVRLMRAQYRLGRQGDALATFQRARAALVETLGIDPSPELQRLEAAILAQATDLDDAQAQACPYRGLASYQLDDAGLFFGRDDLVAELVEAVRAASFVVVVGNSGAGKSSALRAGLVSAIGAGKLSGLRQTAVITPGTSPLRSIYQVPGSVDVVVVVDQFEELFTLTDAEATQREFMRLLLARVNDGSGRVVISLRADFFGHCTALPELAPLLARRQVVVGPLSEHELRVVVTKPAEEVGLVVERELVDVIVAEAANHAGALPLVSHALVETWRRRTGDRLTLEAYREAGSITAAIARTAERVYGSFPPAQRVQAERLFLRLVEPGDGTDHARRKVPYGQLQGSSIDREVIDLLVEARLLTAGAEGIEIAHEALIEAWPRLRSWIDDNRDGVRMHRHLTAAASAWDELGRDEGELYRGVRLSAALSWIHDSTPDLSDLERAFIKSAVAMSETQLKQQVRANRRLRLLVAASVVGIFAATVGIVVAVSKANDADRGRAKAEAAQLVQEVRSEPNLSQSALLELAVAANRRASMPATRALLLDAIAQASGRTAGADLGVQPTGSAPMSANGGVLVGSDDNVLGVVLDATTLKPRVRDLRPAPTVVVDTGKRLLGVKGATLETYDLTSGETIGPPPGVTAGPSQYALSPDGTTLAVANETGASETAGGISLYVVSTGKKLVTLTPPSGGSIREVTFSPGGRHVLAVVGASREVVWETRTGRLVFASRPAEVAAVTRLAMSRSSTVIAVGREDGKVEMRTSDNGLQWPPLDVRSPHRAGISWIDFDSQSQQMVSTSRDGVAVVWDTATGKIAAGPENFGGRGGSTTFFQPGSTTSLVNVASNGLTWKWEPPHGGLSTTVSGVNLGATISASPQTSVLVSGPDGALAYDLVDTAPRQVHLDPDTRIRGIAASGDGKRFVVVHTNGSLELRDAASGALVSSFDQQVEVIGINQGARNANAADYTVRLDILIALDRGGTRVAFQAGDHRIYIVDDHGSSVKTVNLSSHRLDLQSLALSEDGSEVVASTRAGEALWYDVDGSDEKIIAPPGAGFDGQFVSGDRVAVVGRRGVQFIDPRSTETTSLALGVDATRVAVDSSGRLLATAGATGSIQLWDAQFVARIGEPLKLRNLSSPVPMRFSADGHHLVVSEAEETTWVDVWFADWPDLACNLVKEKLSPEVRARYGESLKASELCP